MLVLTKAAAEHEHNQCFPQWLVKAMTHMGINQLKCFEYYYSSCPETVWLIYNAVMTLNRMAG